MKSLVLYESFFGNTQKVAEAIAKELRPLGEVEARHINTIDPKSFVAPDLLVVGAATRGFRPSPDTQNFLWKLPPKALAGIPVAAFDTRIALHEIKNGFLRFIVKTGGFAAKVIQRKLRSKGGVPVISADGFCVTDTEGPLMEGELERARKWARKIVDRHNTQIIGTLSNELFA